MAEADFSSYRNRIRDWIRQWQAGLWRGDDFSDTAFNAWALELFALQFAAVSPYRQFCQSRGATPETIGDWREIPPVSTTAFKALDLTSLPESDRSTVFVSSGTTRDAVSRHYHNDESLSLYEASLLAWFEAHMLPEPPHAHRQFSDTSVPRLLSLTPPKDQAPDSSLVHMGETIRSRLEEPASSFVGYVDDSGWRLDTAAALHTLDRAEDETHPLLIFTTAFSLVHLLTSLADEGRVYRLPKGSRLMETGGYKGRSQEIAKSTLYAEVEHRLGVPPDHIVGEYGMSELSSQAYDRTIGSGGPVDPDQRLFRWPPWTRFQVRSPETGRPCAPDEPGITEIVDLANVRSVLAVETQDLALARDDGLRLLGRAPEAPVKGCSLMSLP